MRIQDSDYKKMKNLPNLFEKINYYKIIFIPFIHYYRYSKRAHANIVVNHNCNNLPLCAAFN